MKITTTLIVAGLHLGGIYAASVGHLLKHRDPSYPCTITSLSDVASVKQSCSTITIGDLVVPAGKTLDLTQLKTGTSVIFTGVVKFGYKEWAGPLISVSGTKVSVTGTSGHVLNGGGAAWWDGKGGNGGKIKPKFFRAHKLFSSTIRGLNILNAPVHCFSIGGCQDLLLDSITIDSRAGEALGHNTDAFNVGTSSNITINKATVYNQDDCLAVNSGTNIKFTNCYCSGGHGVSIGSVGGRADNVVKGVKVLRTTIVNSEQGVRIKTVSGATGSVSDIEYTDITLSGITRYGIDIQQDYLNGGPTGKPTSGVPITNVRLNNIKGSIEYNALPKYILCASCSNFTFTNIAITGGKASQCVGLPSGSYC